MEYHRLDNESDKDLINRICSEKDNIGSWQDVADVLNELLGTCFTESKYRKNFKLYSEGFQDSQQLALSEHTDKISQQLSDIKKERIKLQTLNVERNRKDRAEARQELYYEQIGSLVNTLPIPELTLIYFIPFSLAQFSPTSRSFLPIPFF